MGIKKLLTLSWKKFLLTVVFWFAAVLLHNMISGLIGGEEAVFFILAVFVFPVYLIAAILYSLYIRF